MKFILFISFCFVSSLCFSQSATGQLSAAGSSDPDGSITGYSWALDSACAGCTVTFSANTSVTTNVTFTVPSRYKVSLVVKDNEGAFSDKVFWYITVSQNIKPKAVITGPTDLRLTALLSKNFKNEFDKSIYQDTVLYISSVDIGM